MSASLRLHCQHLSCIRTHCVMGTYLLKEGASELMSKHTGALRCGERNEHSQQSWATIANIDAYCLTDDCFGLVGCKDESNVILVFREFTVCGLRL